MVCLIYTPKYDGHRPEGWGCVYQANHECSWCNYNVALLDLDIFIVVNSIVCFKAIHMEVAIRDLHLVMIQWIRIMDLGAQPPYAYKSYMHVCLNYMMKFHTFLS